MRVSADVDERTLREIYLPGVRARRQGGAAVDGHVLVQPDQRRVRVGEPLAADRGAARRVGLRRARRVRLGRGPRPGRRARRRPRPRDAAATCGVSDARDRRRGAGRRARRGGARRGRRAACSTSSQRARPAPGRSTDLRRRRAPRARPRGRGASASVLLKNDGDVLPLRPAARRPIARDRRVRPHPALPGRRQLAGQPDPRRRRARRAARRRAGRRRRRLRARLRASPDAADDDALADEAVALAARRRRRRRASSACPAPTSPRASTAPHIDLPADQVALLAAARRGQPAASSSCSPTARRCGSSDWEQHAGAILEGWLSGQAGGGAVADVLLGAVNPSGRLTETHPAAARGQPRRTSTSPARPATCATARACSSATAGTTRSARDVGYPFGHGLSYTTFDVRCRPSQATADGDRVDVSCTVTNTGARRRQGGRPALRRRPRSRPSLRPPRELKGFAKVDARARREHAR